MEELKPRLLRTAVGTYKAVEWAGVNTSGFVPIGDMVLVLPDEAETKSKGGIIMPDDVSDRQAMAAESGVIIALGDGAFAYSADRMRGWTGYKPKVGDRVRMERYAGQMQTGEDGLQYRLMTDKCIGGVERLERVAERSGHLLDPNLAMTEAVAARAARLDMPNAPLPREQDLTSAQRNRLAGIRADIARDDPTAGGLSQDDMAIIEQSQR